MRRPIQFWLFVLLIAVSAVFAATLWGDMTREVNRSPEIAFDAQEITVSVSDDRSVLLQGVTASDPEDGDVTGALVVESITEFQEDGSREVTYAAFDSSGNVSKASRQLRYSDYRSPEIKLVQELKTVVGTDINLQDCVRVEDVLDGDLTNQLRIVESDYSNYIPGEYQITIQVTNSAGDTQTLDTQLEIYDPQTNEAALELTDYLVYWEGEDIDYRSYLQSVTAGGVKYSFQPGSQTGTSAGGGSLSRSDISIRSQLDTSQAGVYPVYLTYQDGTYQGTSLLLVVVQ